MPDLEDQQEQILGAPTFFLHQDKGHYTLVNDAQCRWSELVSIFDTENVQAPLALFAPELYLELPFYISCLRAQVPASIGSVYSIPWTLKAMEFAEIDCLVTCDKIFRPFLKKIRETKALSTLRQVILVEEHETDVLKETSMYALPDNITVHRVSNPFYAERN